MYLICFQDMAHISAKKAEARALKEAKAALGAKKGKKK